MRKLTIATSLLLVVLWLGCVVDLPTWRTSDLIPTAEIADDWRRTANGWERSSTWKDSQHANELPPASNLHPGLLASFQILASVGSLLAFSNRDEP